MPTGVCLCVCACLHVCVCVCVHEHVCEHVCLCVCMCMWMCAYMCLHVHVHVYACVCMPAYMCAHVCMYELCACVYMCTSVWCRACIERIFQHSHMENCPWERKTQKIIKSLPGILQKPCWYFRILWSAATKTPLIFQVFVSGAVGNAQADLGFADRRGWGVGVLWEVGRCCSLLFQHISPVEYSVPYTAFLQSS